MQFEGSAPAGATGRRAHLASLHAQFMNAMELMAKERIEERKLTARQRPDADLVPLGISGHALSVGTPPLVSVSI